MKFSLVLFFFLKKIRLRIIKFFFGRYNKINYPFYLKNLLNLKLNLSNNLIVKIEPIPLKKKIYIDLASKKILVGNNFKWKDYELKYFKDTEDFESLHRWKWIIKALSQNQINKSNYKWFLNQVVIWYKNYNFKNNEKNNLIWETYNVSERICNLIIFSKLLNLKLSKDIDIILDNHINYLVNNLEFFGENTGNHIINNARALYLFGCYYDNKKIIKIAEKILLNELPKLLDNDNMLNEGSTHYHFLVQTWLLEIYFFLNQKNRTINPKFLQIIIKMNSVTNYFKKDMIHFPKFGDISPDCSPEWINDIENSIFFKKKYKCIKGTWNYLWKNQKIHKIKNVFSHNNILKNSGYVKIKYKKQIVFFRSSPSISINRLAFLNHAHDDIGHFLYYYNDQPILVDAGRYTYLKNEERFGMFHNLIYANSQLISMNLIKYFILNCLFLDCKITIKNHRRMIKIIFTKKSKIFSNFFLNISRKIKISENSLSLNDEIKNTSVVSKEIITFGHKIKVKKSNLITTSVKKERCNLKYDNSLKIMNNNLNALRYDVIQYGKRKPTNFIVKNFSKINGNNFYLEFNWKN